MAAWRPPPPRVVAVAFHCRLAGECMATLSTGCVRCAPPVQGRLVRPLRATLTAVALVLASLALCFAPLLCFFICFASSSALVQTSCCHLLLHRSRGLPAMAGGEPGRWVAPICFFVALGAYRLQPGENRDDGLPQTVLLGVGLTGSAPCGAHTCSPHRKTSPTFCWQGGQTRG